MARATPYSEDDPVVPWLVLGGLVLVSGVLHVVAWVAAMLLGLLLQRPPVPVAEVVEMELAELPLPAPEPEPEAEPEEPAAPEPPPPPEPPRARPEPRPREAPPPPPTPSPEPPPPAEEAIADFSGETLTNDQGSFQTAVGSGAPMEGPVGQPNARVTGRRREGRPDGTPGGTGTDPDGTVPFADLSRRPTVPAELRDILRDQYPRRAQELGVEGRAVVRVRVGADGRVQPLAVVSETYAGFGDACMRALRASPRWGAPLDSRGQPVDTVVSRFSCTFSFNAF